MKRIAEMILPRAKKQVSRQYLCPITSELMVNPVQASDGWTYECSAISRWCEEHDTSPLDPSVHIDVGNLKPNRALRDVIELLVQSGDLEDAVRDEWKKAAATNASAPQLYREGRIEDAAELGLPCAQGELADRYYRGTGVLQDLATSLKWAHKAAIGGDGLGQFRIAVAHHSGEGAVRDWTLALKYYTLAFQNGQTAASINIQEMYRVGGYGLAKDSSKMFDWCNQSYSIASIHLIGMCYYTGDGADLNHAEARKNFKICASECVDSQYMLGKMMICGEGGVSTLDGVKHIDRAAKQGHAAARVLKQAIIDAVRV